MKTKAHVSFILDNSSSMQSVKAATISGFNEYVKTLQSEKGVDYTFDLTLFDTSIEKRYVNKKLSSLEPLTNASYQPNGSTALYDAVCSTLLSREGNGEKWIVVIMTDGEENASHKYNEGQLKDFVTLLQNTGIVTLAFLGANQNAWATARNWNMHQGNTMTYASTNDGVRGAFINMAQSTNATASSLQASSKNFFAQNLSQTQAPKLDDDFNQNGTASKQQQ